MAKHATSNFSLNNSVTPISTSKSSDNSFYSGIESYTGSFEDSFLNHKKNLKSLNKAYQVDGMYRTGIDRYIESHQGFSLSGKPDIVKFLTTRLNEIALRSNTSWEVMLNNLWCDYWKFGTGVWIKARGSSRYAVRSLYESLPYCITGLIPKSFNCLDNVHQVSTATVWLSPEKRVVETSAEKLSNPFINDRQQDLEISKKLNNNNYLVDNRDVLIVRFKPSSSTKLGIPIGMSALEDMRQLRRVEASVAHLIKKLLFPLVHHKITTSMFGTSISQETAAAKNAWSYLKEDGVLFTGSNHEIKSIGGENQALRVEPYLKHFTSKVIAGLSTTLYDLGFGDATTGAAEASRDLRMVKVNYARSEFSRYIIDNLFNELLYEGGYNPYTNPKHRVTLNFIEVDDAITTKRQTHFADLYTKGVMDLLEARVHAGISNEFPNMEYMHPSTKKEDKPPAEKTTSTIDEDHLSDLINSKASFTKLTEILNVSYGVKLGLEKVTNIQDTLSSDDDSLIKVKKVLEILK